MKKLEAIESINKLYNMGYLAREYAEAHIAYIQKQPDGAVSFMSAEPIEPAARIVPELSSDAFDFVEVSEGWLGTLANKDLNSALITDKHVRYDSVQNDFILVLRSASTGASKWFFRDENNQRVYRSKGRPRITLDLRVGV